jgi:hypothetical protein
MKPRHNSNTLIFLAGMLILSVAWISGARAMDSAVGSSPDASVTVPAVIKNPDSASVAGMPAAGATTATAEQPATTTENAMGIHAMRQRYGHDPTGVRARLGMCRKGRGGHGKGRHRHFHGGNRWKTE